MSGAARTHAHHRARRGPDMDRAGHPVYPDVCAQRKMGSDSVHPSGTSSHRLPRSQSEDIGKKAPISRQRGEERWQKQGMPRSIGTLAWVW